MGGWSLVSTAFIQADIARLAPRKRGFFGVS
jgi:hypothetical protein